MDIITILLLTVAVLLVVWSIIIVLILTRQHRRSYIINSLKEGDGHRALLTNMHDLEHMLDNLRKDAETDGERIEYLRVSTHIIRGGKP